MWDKDWGFALKTAATSFGTVMGVMAVLVIALFVAGYVVKKLEERTHAKAAKKEETTT
ncbi:MAG: hypothetical protein NTV30_03670 [Chloroflexi bacterium]|nr:hypothetical protein [Chloroflexota bacterium]